MHIIKKTLVLIDPQQGESMPCREPDWEDPHNPIFGCS